MLNKLWSPSARQDACWWCSGSSSVLWLFLDWRTPFTQRKHQAEQAVGRISNEVWGSLSPVRETGSSVHDSPAGLSSRSQCSWDYFSHGCACAGPLSLVGYGLIRITAGVCVLVVWSCRGEFLRPRTIWTCSKVFLFSWFLLWHHLKRAAFYVA